MTQEEIELLLQDLCARLPYGVRCSYPYGVSTLQSIDLEDMSLTFNSVDDNYYELDRNINPYLRPMSSMTEEERKEYNDLYYQVPIQRSDGNAYRDTKMVEALHIDWLNKNMFDYRGLIPKGLALEAPEGMYDS